MSSLENVLKVFSPTDVLISFTMLISLKITQFFLLVSNPTSMIQTLTIATFCVDDTRAKQAEDKPSLIGHYTRVDTLFYQFTIASDYSQPACFSLLLGSVTKKYTIYTESKPSCIYNS